MARPRRLTRAAAAAAAGGESAGDKVASSPMSQTRKRPWELEEDTELRIAVMDAQRLLAARHEDGYSLPWAKIAARIPGRNVKQCRERWMHCLDPHITRHPWTGEEIERFLDLYVKYGRRWALIAQKLPGRTDGHVKNKFYSMYRASKKDPGSATFKKLHFHDDGDKATVTGPRRKPPTKEMMLVMRSYDSLRKARDGEMKEAGEEEEDGTGDDDEDATATASSPAIVPDTEEEEDAVLEDTPPTLCPPPAMAQSAIEDADSFFLETLSPTFLADAEEDIAMLPCVGTQVCGLRPVHIFQRRRTRSSGLVFDFNA